VARMAAIGRREIGRGIVNRAKEAPRSRRPIGTVTPPMNPATDEGIKL
jgi:hypothetical protein